MTVENGVRMIAGLFIIISLVLSKLHHEYWLFLTAFVGLNLFQSAFTGLCPMVNILKKLGFKQNNKCC